MDLREYFENTKGTGVLATADAEGRVNAAIYARPRVMDDGTVAFIMADHLSHRYLESNPHAAYLFREAGEGYAGKRLQLTRLKQETDPEKINALRRREVPPVSLPKEGEKRFLVYFQVDSVRPLVGGGEGPE
jgi:hypothetical protein